MKNKLFLLETFFVWARIFDGIEAKLKPFVLDITITFYIVMASIIEFLHIAVMIILFMAVAFHIALIYYHIYLFVGYLDKRREWKTKIVH